MKLLDIYINNFRGIKALHLNLDGLTVLIGENNTGKSTIFEAIRIALTRDFGAKRKQFSEYDFHLENATSAPQTAEPIKIMLHFAEKQLNEWPAPIVQQMAEVIQLDSSNGWNYIRLQAAGSYNPDTNTIESKWIFLNSSGHELILKNQAPFNLIKRFTPLFFLSALRDASQEFGQRGQFWSSFLKSTQLPSDKIAEIENMLQEVNSAVIGANAALGEVTQSISQAGRIVSLDTNPVILEAIPTRVFDMVGKIQVHLKSSSGAKLPLYLHGEGTQSLSVLMLFQAFAANKLAETYAPESSPILALEEPEAHLHPSAARMLGSYLESMQGQVLVSSHSGDLISRVPIASIRRIYKSNGETRIGCVQPNNLSDRERQAINYNIYQTRGYYLFSRCWLLVEGESDFHLMPLLFNAMGHSQDQVSFSVLEISQVIDKGEPFIKFAKALGIQWFLMADGDAAGRDYVNRAGNYLESGESLNDRTKSLTQCDIEHEFWHNGYDDFFERMLTQAQMSTISKDVNGKITNSEEVKQSIKGAIKQAGGKPALAQILITEINRRGVATIPKTLQDIINRVVQLAGG